MTSFMRALVQRQDGAAAIEFAILGPVLLLLLLGIMQVGMLFEADAGLCRAVEEGARYATIFPTPTDSQITSKITAKRFGLKSAYITGPTISHGVSSGANYADISMTYAAPVNFVFFQSSPITLTATRRAFMQ